MFHFSGDCNPRHNLACQPELNLPAGILMLIGLGLALRSLGTKQRHTPAATLLLWLPVMLLPAALTNQGAPHSLRAIGALPAAILLAAWGADWTFDKLRHPAARTALVAILAIAGARDLHRYFNVWAASPATGEAFLAPVAELADYLNGLPSGVPRYVIANEAEATAPVDPARPERRLSLDLQPLILLTREYPEVNYMRIQEFLTANFPPGSVVTPLLGDIRILDTLRARGIPIKEVRQGSVIAALIQ
jgi:hypothetical protein